MITVIFQTQTVDTCCRRVENLLRRMVLL